MSNRDSARLVGLFCLAILITMPQPSDAETWHVWPGQRIGAALDIAAAGDTVLVGNGTFQEQGLVLRDGILLASLNGTPDAVSITTVGGDPILTVAPGAIAEVRGITFTVDAGGLTAPVTSGCGVLADEAYARFHDCRFLDLEATQGGAVHCRDGGMEFFGCEFGGNRAAASGGALNCIYGATVLLDDCVFHDNSAGVTGGAINSAGGSVFLNSCTFDGHAGTALASWNGSMLIVGQSIVTGGDAAWIGDADIMPSFRCTDIWGNDRDWTSAITELADQYDNFSADPLFCPEGTSDEAYALVSISPCAPEYNLACGLVGARGVGCDETVGNDDGPGDGPGEEIPTPAVTRLLPSYPNPFNPHTTVRFDLRRAGKVRITIYDARGRRVHHLLDEHRPAGSHDVLWQGRGDDGRTVAAGVYFIRLEGDGRIDTRRVMMVK